MENTSVAEMRKKFIGEKIMGGHPGVGTLQPRKRSEDPSPPEEPRRDSGSQSDGMNPPMPPKIDETLPAPVRVIPIGVRKPPVPHPHPQPIRSDRPDPPAATDSYESFEDTVPHALSGGKKAHLSPPNDHVDVTVEPSFSTASTSVSAVLAKGISKLPVPLPTGAALRDRTGSHSNDLPSSTVSLDGQ